jgi:hypothetical protein
MSPVARSQGHAGRALLVAAVGVAVALGVAVVVSVLANRGTVEMRLGDDTFRAGTADDLAEAIADEGPILFSDVAGGDRDIWLQHLGDDPEAGWYAFDVRPAGTSRDCVVEWQPDAQIFAAECAEGEFGPDGDGLPQYEVALDDNQVIVDLRSS